MQKRLLDSLKKTLDELDFRQDWISGFIRYVEDIIDSGAVLVLLFGSRAKGEFSRDSDIDLLIVSPILPDVHDRTIDFLCDRLPVQPFVMTPEELEERIEKLDFLIFDAFEDGVILFSDTDMEHINDLLRKSKEHFRLQRIKEGWKFDAIAANAAGI